MESISIGWMVGALAVLFYWLESFLYDLDALQPPVLALAALSVPLPVPSVSTDA